MDPIYVQGLREAKALLDEGVLSQDEFNTEKAELVKQREERKAAAEGGVPPPPSSLPPSVQQHPPPPGQQAGQAGAAGALAPSVARGSKRSRDDAYTVPPGLRHALKPLSKMPGRENMGDSRVRCALCTQKGSVYCLECTKAKGTGIYALCCPSSGRICACLHWSDMVTGHVATWLPYGRAPPEAEGAAGARKTPPAGGKSKGTGRPRGRPVGWRKNKGGAEAGSAGGGSATGGSSDSGIGAAALAALSSSAVSSLSCAAAGHTLVSLSSLPAGSAGGSASAAPAPPPVPAPAPPANLNAVSGSGTAGSQGRVPSGGGSTNPPAL